MKPFICALRTRPDQTGIAISEHLIPLPDQNTEGGIKLTSLIGVLWDEVRGPAPSYHDPSDLVWLSVPEIADPDDEEGEEDEEDDEEDESTEE